MRKRLFRLLFLSLALGAVLPSKAQFFYGLHQTFGKNRVQYNQFLWTFYRFDRFDLYFYNQGEPLAERVAYLVDRNLKELESRLDAPVEDRIQIILFNNLSDLKQSNLNASNEEAYNTGGVTRLAGTKLFVFYTGSYVELEQQLRAGLAEVVLSNLIYGGFTQSLQNSALLNLPQWYVDGLISYLSRPWTAADEALLVDLFRTKQLKRISALEPELARIAGHGFWRYLSQIYGESVVKNVFFMTVISRSMDNGFQFILGAKLKEINKSWLNQLAAEYPEEDLPCLPGKTAIKGKKNHVLKSPTLNPAGTQLAYVDYTLGRYKVYVKNLETGKKKRVLKGGYRIAQNLDRSFPLMAWHPSGKILTILEEEKGFLWLHFVNMETGKVDTKNLFRLDKVLSMEYSPDGKQLLFSAVKEGRTDLYLYTILSTTLDPLTQDDFDDLHPRFLEGGKYIAFASNRTDDSLRINQRLKQFPKDFDLFIYRLGKRNSQPLWRVTNNAGLRELEASPLAAGEFTYLVDDVSTRYQIGVVIDSSIAYVDTAIHYDYTFQRYRVPQEDVRIPLNLQTTAGSKEMAVLYQHGGRQWIQMVEKPDLQKAVAIKDKPRPIESAPQRKKQVLQVNAPEAVKDPREGAEVNILDYSFDASVLEEAGRRRSITSPSVVVKRPAPMVDMGDSLPPVAQGKQEFKIPPKRNYFISFLQDEFTIQVDNIFANPMYQTYTGRPSPNLLNGTFNGLLKVGVVDLFNNYRMVGGVRTDFQPYPGLSLSPNAEFYLGVVNYKNRLNHELLLYRRSRIGNEAGGFFLARYLTHEATYRAIWPFNPVASIRGEVAYRHDKAIILSTDNVSAAQPSRINQFGILRAAYVYDNTRNLGINLYHGLRYKVFTEYYRSLTYSPTGLHTVGLDLRHYLPVHRTIIWANRVAYGSSFGQEKLVHFLGGVDNQFNADFNNETPIATQENYIFQTLVTNMRGFIQNARNGNNFMVINSELRIPIFRYLFNRPISSDFLNSFQIIGFGDVGTAWNGASPWAEENALNSRIVTSGPIKVIIDRQKDPIIAGTGFGLRGKLLGYFVRADWAWGIEDGRVLPQVFYFSLSTDF